MTSRWVPLDGTRNTRDLAGLPTTHGRPIAAQRLLRSDHLQDLSPADVGRLVDTFGVTDVIDLRTSIEVVGEGPGPLTRVPGVRHHHISLHSEEAAQRHVREMTEGQGTGIARPPTKVQDAAYWRRHYLGYLSDRPDSVAGALRVIAEAEGATIVNCAVGKDRTGTIVALALDVAGVPVEEIITDYLLTDERLEVLIDGLKQRPVYAPVLAHQSVEDQRPRRETIEAILMALHEDHGGTGGWLVAQGWTPAEVDALRERLLA